VNIVQVITHLELAGAERVVTELALGLDAAGHRVTVVSLRPVRPGTVLAQRLRDSGVEVRTLNLTKTAFWRVLALRRHLDALHPDVVHAHLFHANLASRAAGIGRRYGLVNTMHGSPGSSWRFRLEGLTFDGCDAYTAVSRAARDHLAGGMGRASESIRVIYNGCPEIRPLEPGEARRIRRRWGLEGCTRVIGSAGRLAPEKGFDLFLRLAPAVGEVIPAGETWGLVILGDGPQRAALMAIAGHAPPNLKIALPGFDPDASRSIGGFDLFVQPSRKEGFGLAAVEAMSHGLPILASRVDALPEIMEFYTHGRVIDFVNGSPRELAATLAAAAAFPRVHPQQPFPLERMVEAYSSLYRELGRA
jgi:glycosyltransferase involved in cell wall biosynthesis